jgi:hypothetical protein
MRYIVGHIITGGRINWEEMTQFGRTEGLGVTITFRMFGQVSLQVASRELAALLAQNQVEWIAPASQGLWLFRSHAFKAVFPNYSDEAWLLGDLMIPMDHDVQRATVPDRDETSCQFVVTPDVIEDQMPKKVFLSHAGVDKPRVLPYKDALESVGIAAWLDEHAMPAGTACG